MAVVVTRTSEASIEVAGDDGVVDVAVVHGHQCDACGAVGLTEDMVDDDGETCIACKETGHLYTVRVLECPRCMTWLTTFEAGVHFMECYSK